MYRTAVAVALCLSAPLVLAWAPSGRGLGRTLPTSVREARTPSSTVLRVSDGEPEDGEAVKMTTLDRESIVYNKEDGRFYESKTADVCREEFCMVDETTGKPIVLSVEEKERIFIDAMQAYFFDGREVLNDADFDQLKEDLLWEGSSVAALSRDENQYLAAMQAYLGGSPTMEDGAFDALKKKLRDGGSPIAVSKEPRCFVDTGICSVTWSKDEVRQFVTYMPTIAVVSVLYLIFAFELTPLRYANPIFGIILGSPLIWFGSIFFAENVFFKNPLVASGVCPDCNADNRVLFGDVLGVEGFSSEAKLKCKNCKVELTVSRSNLRVSSPAKNELPPNAVKQAETATA